MSNNSFEEDELMGLTDKTAQNLVEAIQLSAKNSAMLAKASAHEIELVRQSHTDLKVIVETLAKSQQQQMESTTRSINNLAKSMADSNKELTTAMHDMSKTLQAFGMKSQHSYRELKSELDHTKENVKDVEAEVDLMNGNILIIHKENIDRDLKVSLIEERLQSVRQSAGWWRDNWPKLVTVAVLIGSIVIGIAITLSRVEDLKNDKRTVEIHSSK